MDDKKIKWFFIGLPAALLVMMAVVWGIYRIKSSDRDMPVFGEVTPFEFTERNGEAYGSKELQGKISVINFFFTSCEGPCPRMNGKVAELYKTFSHTQDVQFVSISVDPERDSLQVLQQYAHKFGVTDRRWLFMRAPIEEVKILSEKVFMLAGGDVPSLHSTKLILVDNMKKIRGYYSSEDPESVHLLEKHIRVLFKELH